MLHHIYRAYFGGESKTVLHVPQNEVALLKMLLLVLNPALPTSKTLNSRGLAITEPSLNLMEICLALFILAARTALYLHI